MPTILKNNIRLGGTAPKNILLGGKDVKYAKLGNTIVYDTLSYYSYNTPSITFTYPSGNVAASGGSKTPSARTWSLSYSPVGHSGTTYSGSSTSGTVTSFSIVSGSSYGTLNTSTGVFTFNANSSTSGRSVTIRASVTSNGKSNTKDVTITQSGASMYVATFNVNWPNTWMLCSGSPTHNSTSRYFCIQEGETIHYETFAPGGAIRVNAAAGNTEYSVGIGGTICVYGWSSDAWVLLGSITHQNKNYSFFFY